MKLINLVTAGMLFGNVAQAEERKEEIVIPSIPYQGRTEPLVTRDITGVKYYKMVVFEKEKEIWICYEELETKKLYCPKEN